MELLNTESGEIDWISGHVNGTCKWIWELTRREIGWCEIASNNNDVGIPVGIVTTLDFTRYQEYANDNEKDSIEKILEYYI